MDTKHLLKSQREQLPDLPGIYLFRDEQASVIYVGKAKSLKKRVGSYFTRALPYGKQELVNSIDQIEYLVVRNETEALLTERSFIKRYKPRFNIRLRDDKSYPYIAISLDENFPRVYFTRESHRKDRIYFGPYSNAKRVRAILDLLSKIFTVRSCQGKEPGRQSGSPCLDYYIKRCQAPCVGYVSKEEYRAGIDSVTRFLAGDYREIEAGLERRMQSAAQKQEYEQAAVMRNRLGALRALMEKQVVASDQSDSFDVIAVAVDGVDANAQVFQVRDGLLTDRHSFYLENGAEDTLDLVLREFIFQYYSDAVVIPKLIVLATETELVADTVTWLSERAARQVEVRVAVRGEKRKLSELALRNAKLALSTEKLKAEYRHKRQHKAMQGLMQVLDLPSLPTRVECYDISHLGGTNTVASMTVFDGGEAAPKHYRSFNIEGIKAGDDFAAMAQVIERRVARWQAMQEISPYQRDYDESFAALPQVVVIDGGKGQLASALKVGSEFIAAGVKIISLAKRIEEVFIPGKSSPLLLAYESPELQLLQQIRDEAHRFALKRQRSRRKKDLTGSVLDSIPGIGQKRKRVLLRYFGSPEAVTQATREQLEAVPGMPAKVARELYEALHRTT